MHNSLSRTDVALFCGILAFAIAVAGTLTGELPGRFGEVSSQTKDPKQYWSALAMYYLAGIGFLGFYLYQIGAFSN